MFDTRKSLIEGYQECANEVDCLLNLNNQFWIERYLEYAKDILKNKEEIRTAVEKFQVEPPLYRYLTMGSMIDWKNNKKFSLRYLGQEVGSIKTNGKGVYLSVDKNTAANNQKFFNCDIGLIAREEREKAASFTKYFKDFVNKKMNIKYPRQNEHMVESALYSEVEKKSNGDKGLHVITLNGYEGVRTHMKTALKASNPKELNQSIKGGEIDLFCYRWDEQHKKRLVVIEVKDENKSNEGFDVAIKQAIAYAVFIRNLIRSEAGDNWMKIWGMENQSKENLIIDAVVAMPWDGPTKPSFGGKKIKINSEDGFNDCIELHYIGFTEKEVTPNMYSGIEFMSSY